LDHLGAEVAEYGATEGPGQELAEFENADAVKRRRAAVAGHGIAPGRKGSPAGGGSRDYPSVGAITQRPALSGAGPCRGSGRDGSPQCDMSTGTVMYCSMWWVTPPRTSSRNREWPHAPITTRSTPSSE